MKQMSRLLVRIISLDNDLFCLNHFVFGQTDMTNNWEPIHGNVNVFSAL